MAETSAIYRRAWRSLLNARFDSWQEAVDGDTAIRIAKRVKPDIVLADVHVTGTNGIEIARVLADELPATRVVVTTARGSREERQRSREAGAFGYVDKNLHPEAVQFAVTWVSPGAARVGTARPLQFHRPTVAPACATGRHEQLIGQLQALERNCWRAHEAALARAINSIIAVYVLSPLFGDAEQHHFDELADACEELRGKMFIEHAAQLEAMMADLAPRG